MIGPGPPLPEVPTCRGNVPTDAGIVVGALGSRQGAAPIFNATLPISPANFTPPRAGAVASFASPITFGNDSVVMSVAESIF